MLRVLLIVGTLVAVALTYVRFAPVDPARWHLRSYVDTPGDYPGPTGFRTVRLVTTTPDGILRAVERIALTTPRTKVVAGSIEDGMLTFETRSAVFGFADYTTVYISEGPSLAIDGRLRFGINDVGVNEARIRGWMAQLGPLVVPLS